MMMCFDDSIVSENSAIVNSKKVLVGKSEFGIRLAATGFRFCVTTTDFFQKLALAILQCHLSPTHSVVTAPDISQSAADQRLALSE